MTDQFVEKRAIDIGPPGDGTERRGERRPAEEPSLIDKAEKGLGRWIALGIGALTMGGALTTWGVITNPYETKAHAEEVRAATTVRIDDHERRLLKQEATLNDVLVTGKESQELQLIERIEKLQARAEDKPRGSPEAIEARRDIAEAEQRLSKVRRELGR